MASILRIVLQDADGRTGNLDLPVDDVALPAGYQAKIDAVTAVLGGTSNAFLTQATVKRTEVIISSPDNDTLPAAGDIRTTWIFKAQDITTPQDPFTFQMPGRNTNPVLTLAIAKNELLDTSQPAYTAFVTALQAAGVNLVDADTGETALLQGARASVTKRKAPRI